MTNETQKIRWSMYRDAVAKGLTKKRGGYSIRYLLSWLRKYEKVNEVVQKFKEWDREDYKDNALSCINNWKTAELTKKEILLAKQFKKCLNHATTVEELLASYQTPWGYGFFSIKYWLNWTTIEDYAYYLRYQELWTPK